MDGLIFTLLLLLVLLFHSSHHYHLFQCLANASSLLDMIIRIFLFRFGVCVCVLITFQLMIQFQTYLSLYMRIENKINSTKQVVITFVKLTFPHLNMLIFSCVRSCAERETQTNKTTSLSLSSVKKKCSRFELRKIFFSTNYNISTSPRAYFIHAEKWEKDEENRAREKTTQLCNNNSFSYCALRTSQ